ncbi:ThiF family protein [Coccidioides posadasii C735 delta SOWgp]|uniref:ThiF family protein n=1 Tax=Coccidioides posadasii (strain C735) TaxID=222929 RepID=C5P567_COCP7|nr:ThiF family protein [Coccidioides posadasii C735 delta SOWgp]EER27857.1 ThiF family protein [Coccidioides posadasii C735 delta SOWgp]|eukprot:XP_003070002.1 ThiF family protein [Coccidioides posadasii C735 delta SOWgp]
MEPPFGRPRRSNDRNRICGHTLFDPGFANDTDDNNFQTDWKSNLLLTMSSWIQRQTNSQYAQLAGAALLSGTAVAGAILGYQAIKRKAAVEELKKSIPGLDDSNRALKLSEFGVAPPPSVQQRKEDEHRAAIARRAQDGYYDEELILEQLARNRVFLTDKGLEKLRSSFIIVVGCGGVGSHASAALARSGVGRIRLIDFDQVTLSSLNRHAVATLADVGMPKVRCLQKRLEQIAPWVRFDPQNTLFAASAADQLLGPWSMPGDDNTSKPHFVLDCIDNISSKVDLLRYCHSQGIPVISSMGAGCKSDPTRILVGDISTSLEDPLSRSTRRRLKALGVTSGVPVVYSTEKPGPGKAALLPLPEEEFAKGEVGELSVLPDFRVRILPVLGTMPAVFGYTLANHVICDIAGYPNDYNSGIKGREKLYDSVLGALQGMEERLAKHDNKDPVGLRIPITKDDVGYLLEEVWRGKSVVSGLTTRLALVRWERPGEGFGADPKWDQHGQKGVKMRLRDLVCMTKDEAQRHEREVLKGGKKPAELYDESVLIKVQQRMREEEEFERYR